MGKRFRQIYKEGPVFPLKVAFSSESMSDLLQRLKYMELVAEHDANLMADYRIRLDGLNGEKESLLAVRAKLVRLEKDALGKQGEFEKARKDKKYFLKKIKKKKRLGIQTRKELLKASNNLNDLIGKLLTKLVSGVGLDITDKKGRLSLPVKGKILNKFSRQKDNSLLRTLSIMVLISESGPGCRCAQFLMEKYFIPASLRAMETWLLLGMARIIILYTAIWTVLASSKIRWFRPGILLA